MNQNWRYIYISKKQPVFWYFAGSRSHEIQVEILPNTRQWNIIGTFRGLIAVNVITTMSEQRSKTTRRKLCCEKLGTSHDVKSFATKSAVFYRLFFGEFSAKMSAKFQRNRPIFPWICPWKFRNLRSMGAWRRKVIKAVENRKPARRLG